MPQGHKRKPTHQLSKKQKMRWFKSENSNCSVSNISSCDSSDSSISNHLLHNEIIFKEDNNEEPVNQSSQELHNQCQRDDLQTIVTTTSSDETSSSTAVIQISVQNHKIYAHLSVICFLHSVFVLFLLII